MDLKGRKRLRVPSQTSEDSYHYGIRESCTESSSHRRYLFFSDTWLWRSSLIIFDKSNGADCSNSGILTSTATFQNRLVPFLWEKTSNSNYERSSQDARCRVDFDRTQVIFGVSSFEDYDNLEIRILPTYKAYCKSPIPWLRFEHKCNFPVSSLPGPVGVYSSHLLGR